MKKIVICLAAVIVTVMMVFALAACYNSAHPASMGELVGTYELETYKIGTPKTEDEMSKKESEDESNFNYADKIAEKGIKCYLVVRDDGKGYYVYQDNDTPAYAKEVKIIYTADDEETEKITKIKYSYGQEHKTDDYPGCGEEDLGVNAKTKTLNWYLGIYTTKYLGKRDYTQSVTYKKVDKATDLSYVNKKLSKNFIVAPYELNGLDGAFSSSYSFYEESSEYIYYAINMRVAEGKADIYYALKEDGESRVLSNLTLTYALPTGQDDKITLNVGETAYVAYYYGNTNENSSVPMTFGRDVYGENENGEQVVVSSVSFYKISGTLADWIEQQKQSYSAYSTQS